MYEAVQLHQAEQSGMASLWHAQLLLCHRKGGSDHAGLEVAVRGVQGASQIVVMPRHRWVANGGRRVCADGGSIVSERLQAHPAV